MSHKDTVQNPTRIAGKRLVLNVMGYLSASHPGGRLSRRYENSARKYEGDVALLETAVCHKHVESGSLTWNDPIPTNQHTHSYPPNKQHYLEYPVKACIGAKTDPNRT